MAYTEENYIQEWNIAFDDIVEKVTQSGSIYKNILEFIEDKKTDGIITKSEYLDLSLKTMIALQNQITTTAQATAFQLVDKKFGFGNELNIRKKELDIKNQAYLNSQKDGLIKVQDELVKKQQILKEEASTAFENERTVALKQQVIDNRKIKSVQILGDTYGAFGANGITVSTDMWSVYFKLVGELTEELNDYKGEWNADTNSPDLTVEPAGGIKEGDFYHISTDGTTNVDGTNSWTAGEIIVRIGDRWKKSLVTLPTSTDVTKVPDAV